MTQSSSDNPRYYRNLFLAGLVAVYCLVTVIVFADSQGLPDGTSLWPFPGIYFLEIILLGGLSLISIIKNSPPGEQLWTGLPWIGAGGLLAFVILGAWTIGFFLIPAMVFSVVIGVLEDKRKKENIALHVILFLASALVQGLIVFIVVTLPIS